VRADICAAYSQNQGEKAGFKKALAASQSHTKKKSALVSGLVSVVQKTP
jgi:hypothetical protein